MKRLVLLAVLALAACDSYPKGYTFPISTDGSTVCNEGEQPLAQVNIRLLPDTGRIPKAASDAIKHERTHKLQRDSFPGGCRKYEIKFNTSKIFAAQQEAEAYCIGNGFPRYCEWMDSVVAVGQWRHPKIFRARGAP